MKLKRLISALIVFTLVMACMVTASAADTNTVGVSAIYTTGGNVKVTATVTGATNGDMISYVIYQGQDITQNSIKYIDQATVKDNAVSFEVTDSRANLEGMNIKFGTNGDAFTYADDDTVDEALNKNAWMTIDAKPIANTAEKSVTFLMTMGTTIAGKHEKGIKVTASKNGDTVDFGYLAILGDHNNAAAIQLISEDEKYNSYFDGTWTFSAVPYYKVSDVSGYSVLSQSIDGSEYYVDMGVAVSGGALESGTPENDYSKN